MEQGEKSGLTENVPKGEIKHKKTYSDVFTSAIILSFN